MVRRDAGHGTEECTVLLSSGHMGATTAGVVAKSRPDFLVGREDQRNQGGEAIKTGDSWTDIGFGHCDLRDMYYVMWKVGDGVPAWRRA